MQRGVATSSNPLLGPTSLVVSSAASLSVGEGAAVHIVPGGRTFHCGGRDPGAAGASQQHGVQETGPVAVGLLAGEQLLLHGTISLGAAPSDCLPAPLRKTPVLLFGGREVSLRGEQQLDRLILLSQGIVTLAGSCTVGGPHRCNAQPIPLIYGRPAAGSQASSPRSSICDTLEEYTKIHVAPHLQSVAEAASFAATQMTPERYPAAEEELLATSQPFPSSLITAPSAIRDLQVGATRSLPSGTEGQASNTFQAFGRRCALSAFANKELAEETSLHETRFQRLIRCVRGLVIDGEQTALVGSDIPSLLSRRQEPSTDKRPAGVYEPLAKGDSSFVGKRPLTSESPHVDPLGRVWELASMGLNEPRGTLRRGRRLLEERLSQLLKPDISPDSLEQLPLEARPVPPYPSTVSREEAKTTEAAADEAARAVAAAAEADLFSSQGTPVQQETKQSANCESAERAAPALAPLGIPSFLWRSLSSLVPLEFERPTRSASGCSGGILAVGEETATREYRPTNLSALSAVEASSLLHGGKAPWSYLDAAIFAGESLLVEPGASLVGGGLLLCGSRGNTQLRGVVDASRRGCQPLHGEAFGRSPDIYEPSAQPCSPSCTLSNSLRSASVAFMHCVVFPSVFPSNSLA